MQYNTTQIHIKTSLMHWEFTSGYGGTKISRDEKHIMALTKENKRQKIEIYDFVIASVLNTHMNCIETILS